MRVGSFLIVALLALQTVGSIVRLCIREQEATGRIADLILFALYGFALWTALAPLRQAWGF